MIKLTSTMCLLLLTIGLCAQTISKHHFSYNGKCELENKLNTVDGKGNCISVYECLVPTSSTVVTAYRVNVITFKNAITDVAQYYKSIYSEYTSLGNTANATLAGNKAVQCTEDVNIEGHLMKQISIATLYKNKSITIVLLSNDDNYLQLLNSYKQNFHLN